MSGDTFFEKVSTRNDRERVYALLVEQKISITAVDQKKTQFKLVPKYLAGSKLILALPAGEANILGEAILTFDIGAEKYFMKAILEPGRGSDVALDIQKDLFKLQRRNSFRLNIPQTFIARIEIRKRSSTSVKERQSIVDLSGGGFAFEVSTGEPLPYKKDEVLVGQLQLGIDFNEEVKGVIRHVRMVGSRASGLCRVGVQFEGLGESVQNRIVTIVMNIHRDMFSKFKLG